jgi:hypothetical protein
MSIALVERDILAELAETDEIMEARRFNQRNNEMTFADGGIDSLSSLLLGVCDRKLYIGQEADVYYDILDTRDFLKEKYDLLSETEAAQYKEHVEEAINEAEEVLNYIRNEMSQ